MRVCVYLCGSKVPARCHTGSPSGMFLGPAMGCGASLAEPPSPRALSAGVSLSPSRTAAASCESFWAWSVSLSVAVPPGCQTVGSLDGLAVLSLADLSDCLYGACVNILSL